MLTVMREHLDEDHEGEQVMLIKGAPDILFPACDHALNADGSSMPFDRNVREQVSRLQSEWSRQGQRVLALCMKSLHDVDIDINNTPASEIEMGLNDELNGLTLVGLVGIRDPARDDVRAAMDRIRNAGWGYFTIIYHLVY